MGGLRSYFLDSKDGRRPLQPSVLKALLPTASEAGSLQKEVEEEGKKEKAAEQASQDKKEIDVEDMIRDEDKEMEIQRDEQPTSIDSGARRASTVEGQYCGGFENSTVCNII